MLKRFVCLILLISILISSTIATFAADLDFVSGSAFGVDEPFLRSSLLAASASAPVGSSSDPFYVKPFTSGNASMYRYTWSSSNPNGSASGVNVTFTNFADIVTHITNSIAQSFLGLAQRLHYDNDSIYSRLADILTAINSSVSGVVKIADNSDNNFTQDYLWKKYLTATSGSLPRLSSGGVYSTQSVNFSNMSVLGAIEAMLYYTATGATNGISLLVRDVRDNSAALDDYLYDKDLNPTLIPRTTVWQNMRDSWSNTSFFLSRLAFTLANDEDIELRQSQADNLDSLKDNLTSGDVSLSPSKIVGTKDIGSSISDSFSSSASIDDGLSILNSGSDSWSWFSNDVSQSLDSSSSNRLLKSERSFTPYLDSYYREVAPYVD